MKSLQKIVIVVLLIVLIGSLGMSQHEIYNRRIQYRTEDRIFLLPRKEILKRLAMGHDKTVADLLWIRSIQFFGGNFTTLTKKGMEYKGEGIKKLFDTIQYLDPKFYKVYDFGSFVFNEGLRDHEAAVELLDKGSNEFENDWRLLFDAAFVCFYYMNDKERALDFADRAGARPNAPDHTRRFKGQILSQIGSYDAAAEHFLRMMEESQNDLQKEIARNNLMRVLREKTTYQLEQAIADYREKTDQPIHRLEQLVEAGILSELPMDPEDGGPFFYIWPEDKVVSYNQAYDKEQNMRVFMQRKYDDFYSAYGYYPEKIEDLMSENELEDKMKDPLGGQWSIDTENHQIIVIPLDQ